MIRKVLVRQSVSWQDWLNRMAVNASLNRGGLIDDTALISTAVASMVVEGI